ncbi:hypothetical protein DLH72_00725 [Candidatus Gracilibacteria bacterium]|nr:MAG: hypothetical protein DLH72_00725 [Candidatus Gracilibacteria bacterium]
MESFKVINLDSLIEFFDGSAEDAGKMKIEISDQTAVIINSDRRIENVSINISQQIQNKVVFFPIIKCLAFFKGVKCLPTNTYVFLFLYIVDENNILIFSNDILKYLKEFDKGNSSIVQGEDNHVSNDVFQKLTSSFYLFTKSHDTGLYEWKNILEFFPLFLHLSFQNNDYANLLHKITGDSVAFFKSRFVQEKNIKTIIKSKEEGTSFFNSMFYANILKNLTFRIAGSYIDLNARGKGGFHITTTQNSEEYFEKNQNFIEAINQAKGGDKTNFPVFFSEGYIGKDDQEDLCKYEFIDIFPVAFKKDSKGNTYILNFKNTEQESDSGTYGESITLKSLFYKGGKKHIIYDTKKKMICKKYVYSLLEEKNSKVDQDYGVLVERPVQDTDLYILFLGKNKELFIGKIKSTPLEGAIVTRKEGKKNKQEQIYIFSNMTTFFSEKQKIKKYQKEKRDYRLESHKVTLDKNLKIHFKITKQGFYIDAYKLYFQFGKYVLDESRSILLRKKKEHNVSEFYLGNGQEFGLASSITLEGGHDLNFLTSGPNADGLTYFFNGASIKSEEDRISLGVIGQLNGGVIYVGNRKSHHGELADIIGYKKDGNKSIIHLIHLKKSPFTTNGRTETYSYYTTAIGQMLQKIEPILSDSSKTFFTQTLSVDKIKEESMPLWGNIKEFNVQNDFLRKISNSQSIELRIGIVILKEQMNGDINNRTFYMIEKILLSGYLHSLKPFISQREIDINFYPVIIDTESD